MSGKLFSIDTKTQSNIVIYIFGIKIRLRKKEVKDSAKKYFNMNCPITEIPPAQGSLRKVQLANLKLLKTFDKLCTDNELNYWLDFGNLLGAVRHKGFIPWDDDVDVSMVRDDYEKFIELFQNGFPEFDDLYLEFNNNGKNRCFVKVLHKKIPDIAIDIFPYDFYYKKISPEEKLKITQKIKKAVNKNIYKIIRPFFLHRPDKMRERFAKIRKKEILNNNIVDKKEEPSLFYGIDYPHRYGNYFFDYDKIFPLKKIKFEDMEFPCPNDETFVLKQVFKNYMNLPQDCYPCHVYIDGLIEDELNKYIGGE